MTNTSSAGLWGRWSRRVTAGELAGFLAPATVGALSASWASQWSYPAILAAGAVEGALLGWAQASVLRRVMPLVRARRFVVLTSVGAVVAYAVGMLPSTFAGRLGHVPVPLLVVAGALAALVLLGSIGTAQWLELRRSVPRAGHWVTATALAWVLGLAVFSAVAMPLWHEGQAVIGVILVGLFAGFLMAATVAAVTGAALVRLVDRLEHAG